MVLRVYRPLDRVRNLNDNQQVETIFVRRNRATKGAENVDVSLKGSIQKQLHKLYTQDNISHHGNVKRKLCENLYSKNKHPQHKYVNGFNTRNG